MTKQAQKTGRFSTQLAIASFATGTALFLVNNTFHFSDLLFIGNSDNNANTAKTHTSTYCR